MNKPLLRAFVFFILAISLAVGSYIWYQKNSAPLIPNELAFPNLATHTADINTITIRTKKYQFTFNKKNNQWIDIETQYALNNSPINDILSQLSKLQILEEKPTDSKNGEKLGLLTQDEAEELTSNPHAQGDQIILSHGNAILYHLVIGYSQRSINAHTMNRFYLRDISHDVAWLVSGEITLPQSAEQLWEPYSLTVPLADVNSVEISSKENNRPIILNNSNINALDSYLKNLHSLPVSAVFETGTPLPARTTKEKVMIHSKKGSHIELIILDDNDHYWLIINQKPKTPSVPWIFQIPPSTRRLIINSSQSQ